MVKVYVGHPSANIKTWLNKREPENDVVSPDQTIDPTVMTVKFINNLDVEITDTTSYQWEQAGIEPDQSITIDGTKQISVWDDDVEDVIWKNVEQ